MAVPDGAIPGSTIQGPQRLDIDFFFGVMRSQGRHFYNPLGLPIVNPMGRGPLGFSITRGILLNIVQCKRCRKYFQYVSDQFCSGDCKRRAKEKYLAEKEKQAAPSLPGGLTLWARQLALRRMKKKPPPPEVAKKIIPKAARVVVKGKRAKRLIREKDKEISRLKRQLLEKPVKAPTLSFYDSREWHTLRYQVLKTHGRRCMACGTTSGVIQVDHVKPRSKYPELELVFSNLQVLCRPCNMGKSNTDETDWRASAN